MTTGQGSLQGARWGWGAAARPRCRVSSWALPAVSTLLFTGVTWRDPTAAQPDPGVGQSWACPSSAHSFSHPLVHSSGNVRGVLGSGAGSRGGWTGSVLRDSQVAERHKQERKTEGTKRQRVQGNLPGQRRWCVRFSRPGHRGLLLGRWTFLVPLPAFKAP